LASEFPALPGADAMPAWVDLVAERYGWVTRAMADAELDRFVDGVASRLAPVRHRIEGPREIDVIADPGRLGRHELAFRDDWQADSRRVPPRRYCAASTRVEYCTVVTPPSRAHPHHVT
jgi:hypothetical protein